MEQNSIETAQASSDGKLCLVNHGLSFGPVVLTNDEERIPSVARVGKSSQENGEILFSIVLPSVTFEGTASFSLADEKALRARYVVVPNENTNILSVELDASLPGKFYRGGTYAFRDGMDGVFPDPGHGFAIAALGEAVAIGPGSKGLGFTLERDLCGPIRIREDALSDLFRLRVPFASRKLTKGVPYELGFTLRLPCPLTLEWL